MQKHKTYQAMMHKMRVRGSYYYHWKNGGPSYRHGHPIQEYYSFEKKHCKSQKRTCQSALFAYDVEIPIWCNGKTFWEYHYE